ncbi:hypothetical protein FQA39_LY08587 [Lamprigera yunnana]|nr:hypothetical protein FQA39_LY08587 [Lamprigera yunnana]
MLKELKGKLNKMEERYQRMERKLDGLQKGIQTIKAENEQLREENRYLTLKNAQHEKMFEEINREIRKRNIIIYRLEDLKEESVSEVTIHVVTTLGSVNLEYFFWRAIGNVNCNYCGTVPNVSGIHER